MQVLNVAILINSLRQQGPVLLALDLTNTLIDEGHRVEIFYLRESMGVEFPCPCEKIDFSSLKKLKNFDVIHSHSFRPDIFSWFLKNVLNFKPRFISTIHNYVEQDLKMEKGQLVSGLIAPIWRRIWNRLDGVVTLSQNAQKYYLSTSPSVNSTVIYNSRRPWTKGDVNSKDRILLEGLKKKYRIIGSNAAVVKRKGFEQIIKSLLLLKNHVFVLVGEGPELPELVNMARKLAVLDRFFVLGFRPNARDYLFYYDIFAMPSYSEGMPLAMLEATLEGVPVVCSKIPVFEEIFSDSEVCFFQLHDIKALALALNTPYLVLKENSKRAYLRTINEYSTAAMIKAYINLYSK